MKYPTWFPRNTDKILLRYGFSNAIKYDKHTVVAQNNETDYYFQFPKYPYNNKYTLYYHIGLKLKYDDYKNILPPIAQIGNFRFIYFSENEFKICTIKQWFKILYKRDETEKYFYFK